MVMRKNIHANVHGDEKKYPRTVTSPPVVAAAAAGLAMTSPRRWFGHAIRSHMEKPAKAAWRISARFGWPANSPRHLPSWAGGQATAPRSSLIHLRRPYVTTTTIVLDNLNLNVPCYYKKNKVLWKCELCESDVWMIFVKRKKQESRAVVHSFLSSSYPHHKPTSHHSKRGPALPLSALALPLGGHANCRRGRPCFRYSKNMLIIG